jgi:mono/diheme cytochrome c family protein
MKKISFFLMSCMFIVSCQDETNNFTQLASGYELYQKNCANCHGDDGLGLAKLIPPLKNADYLLSHKDSLKSIIHKGIQVPIVVNGITYTSPMPAMPKISASEAESIIQFILIKFNQTSNK